MKKLLTIVLCLACLNLSFSQKVKIKKGTITVDGSKWGLIEEESWGERYTFSTLDGQEYCAMVWEYLTPDNKEDLIIRVNFFTTEEKSFRIEANDRKQLIQWFIKSGVITNGKFSKEHLAKFKKRYGAVPLTKKKETTIIIKHEE